MRTCCVYFPWYCPILTFRARGNATKAYRYDIVQHFVTAAPPEHDDLTFLRVAKIRLERHQFRVSRTDLPSELQASPRNRIALVNEYPASAAMVFKRKKDMLLDDIIDASRVDPRESVAITLSVNPHAYSRVAAFTLCIEPQMDGRLHLHSTARRILHILLTRIAGCNEREAVADWLDTFLHTHLRRDSYLVTAVTKRQPGLSAIVRGPATGCWRRLPSFQIGMGIVARVRRASAAGICAG
eukprot:GHVR01136926.1.p1 GENE.GHVR01136926.1~~GHVR01136926.1.p1  ORF type:complete len:241 (-),score=-4.37 GHVR01136926.1:667-1389(-)